MLALAGFITASGILIFVVWYYRRKQAALMASEARFRRLFDNADIPIWDQDFSLAVEALEKIRRNGVKDLSAYLAENPGEDVRLAKLIRTHSVNEATLLLHDAESEQAFIDELHRNWTEETVAAMADSLCAIWQGEEFFSTELSRKTDDGEDIVVVVTMQIPRKTQDFGHVPVCAVDVTDRKRAEVAMRLAKEEAEAANRTKTEFLAHMSHELRTPLNSIIGFSALMEDGDSGALEAQDYAEGSKHIQASARHLLAVINDILDTSKVEAGEFDLKESGVVIADVLSMSSNMIKVRSDAKAQTLLLEVADDISNLWADERLLRQIMINLLTNAVKFTPEGGSIKAAACLSDQDEMILSVEDNGVGIAANDIAKALEPFGQIRRPGDMTNEGTGLGLSLSKKLIDLHDGTLLIESEVGKGTTVSVTFPPLRTITSSQ